MKNEKDTLTPTETSRRLGITVGTLNRWRARGLGPKFIKYTARHIRYRPQDVDAYLESMATAPESGAA